MKKIFLILAAVMMSIAASVTVYAVPEDGTAETAETAPTAMVVDAADAAENSQNERGGIMSVGGVILVGVLVVVINTVISFFVANRFYKLTKKDSHIQAEIRALRRDIDDKFSGNVTQIKEKNVKVKNSNPDYSGGEKIKVKKPEKQKNDDEEIAEFAKRWNIEIERDEEPETKTPRTEHSYSPERKKTKTKGKAKEFMGEIFPFDEDK